MCLGVPMRVVDIEGFNATCEARGIRREASLFLLQHEEVRPGDFVMIHRGNVLQKLSEEEGRTAWALDDDLVAAEEAGSV